jgi:transposase
MGKPYPIDLQERVQADIENGQSRRAAARRYEVSASFAVKLAERLSRLRVRIRGVLQRYAARPTAPPY